MTTRRRLTPNRPRAILGAPIPTGATGSEKGSTAEDRHALQLVERSRLGAFASAWDQLVDRLPLPSPFLRSWWLEATTTHRPCFLLVLDRRATLVGGLALEQGRRWPVRWFRLLGTGPLCPDHLALVADPGREDDVVAALAAWMARPGSRVFDLEGIAEGSRLAAALPGRVRRSVVDVAPWATLPASPDDWLRERPRGFRVTVGKTTRRLAAEGMEHRVVPLDAVDAAMERLRRLHQAHWGDASKFLAGYDRFAAAGRLGAARGEFAFHELAAGDTVVAAVTSFEVAGRVSLYQSGRVDEHRWRSATTVLLTRTIQDACRRGFGEVDLLRGDEPYKRNLASGTREILELKAAKGLSGRLALLLAVGAAGARRLAGHLLRRTARRFNALRSRPGDGT
jgi:CelD/BcsL family acetyltransferase involved in cellulose biosynthesis